ncbi:MAG: hypothetical protein A2Z11_00455 [Candidatus Woykebacteria bacterium RBG_16_43_9]|uniref:Cell division protein FtsL n=1 Tax=Candidatus Woykebacteria bacterium RBG_16_43_9 TaxID=1802596 RepID=A0A1G1WEX7_9BACT|nr:MAG: hypothetical protein A2Z11_00455 [Candidatus Woykebacteria bacterium RBG_16_43_9]
MIRKGAKQDKPKSFYKSLVTFLIIAVLSVSFARVIFANILATSGQQLAAANQKVSILNEENQDLENRISTLKSLTRVEKTATKKGFVKTKNVEVLSPAGPIANK